MPTVMLILNVVFIAGVVLGVVGLLAWGIVTDRPRAAAVNERALARTRARERRPLPRDPRPAFRRSSRPIDLRA
jgi:hypothetical protein